MHFKKDDFSYENLKRSLMGLNNFCLNYDDPNLDRIIPTIGNFNNLTIANGSALFMQKEILDLKLENSKLKRLDELEINELEEEQAKVGKLIEIFLEENHWVD